MNTYNFKSAILGGKYADLLGETHNQLKEAAIKIHIDSNKQKVRISLAKFVFPLIQYRSCILSIIVNKSRILLQLNHFENYMPIKYLSKLTLLDKISILKVLEDQIKINETVNSNKHFLTPKNNNDTGSLH